MKLSKLCLHSHISKIIRAADIFAFYKIFQFQCNCKQAGDKQTRIFFWSDLHFLEYQKFCFNDWFKTRAMASIQISNFNNQCNYCTGNLSRIFAILWSIFRYHFSSLEKVDIRPLLLNDEYSYKRIFQCWLVPSLVKHS